VTYRQPTGFTLVELMLYVALSGFVLMSVVGVFTMSIQLRARTSARQEVNEQGDAALQTITQLIRDGYSVDIPVYASTTSQLSLSSKDAALHPTTVILVSGLLEAKEGTVSPVNLTSRRVIASNLSFANISQSTTASAVRVVFTLSYASQGASEYQYQRTFSATVSIR
jgi:type II secretory pathway pseudopilin PulG